MEHRGNPIAQWDKFTQQGGADASDACLVLTSVVTLPPRFRSNAAR